MTELSRSYGVAILTISDTASADSSADRSGPLLASILESASSSASSGPSSGFIVRERAIEPDSIEGVRSKVQEWAKRDDIDWIITSGGTGFGTRDWTPEAISPLITRPAPGLVHLIMQSSLVHTPLAALSRPIAGIIDPTPLSPSSPPLSPTLVITLPGSPKAVQENMDALLKSGEGVITHALELMRGEGKTVRNVHREMQGEMSRDAHAHTSTHGRGHHHHHHHHDHAPPVPKSHDPSLGAAARHRSSPYPLIPLEEALSIVSRETSPLEVITRPVDASLAGHVLVEDIIAEHNLPLSGTTNVDGYAIDSTLPAGTYPVLTPRTFSISGPSAKAFPKGHIYRINTGSPLPLGTDAVVMVEDTQLVKSTRSSTSTSQPSSMAEEDEDDEELEVKLLVGASKGENVRQPGSDTRAGELVLKSGTRITERGGEVGTLAFVGRREIKVYRKPRIGLMSTGNEIIDLQSPSHSSTSKGEEQGRDGWTGTFDTNRPSLQAALHGLGYGTGTVNPNEEVMDYGIVPDTLEAHISTIRSALSKCDVLITTGGSSMGSSDLLKPVIERHLGGTIHFGRVVVKPGKPTTFATVDVPASENEGDGKTRRKYIFVLPGNPASALVMFYIFVVPALRKLGGWDEKECALPRIPVELMDDLPLDPRPEFHRVHIRVNPLLTSPGSGTALRAYSTGGQRSSRIASLAGANGLVACPALMKDEGAKKVLKKGEVAMAVLVGEIQVEV